MTSQKNRDSKWHLKVIRQKNPEFPLYLIFFFLSQEIKNSSSSSTDTEDEIIKEFKKDLATSESDESNYSTKVNFGGTACDSSGIPSSWDESETTATTVFSSNTTTSDSEDELIKEFRKDLESSKLESDSEDSSHSSKISVIEQSGTYLYPIFSRFICMSVVLLDRLRYGNMNGIMLSQIVKSMF